MKKIATLLVILGTMTCHVMAQEINVESLLKKADDAAKLADKYPKDGLKQIYAAEALTNIALNEKRDFDRAQTYTSRALDIAKKQKVLKDTLLAKTYFLMANTNMVLASYAIACDYYEMAIDAAEKELGRYSPYTIFTRMMAGRAIMMVAHYQHGSVKLLLQFRYGTDDSCFYQQPTLWCPCRFERPKALPYDTEPRLACRTTADKLDGAQHATVSAGS